MKKIISIKLSVVLGLFLLVFGCENDFKINTSNLQTIVVAPFVGDDETRVTLTPDEGGLGFKSSWSIGDELVVSSEDGSTYIGTFVIRDGGILEDGGAKFTSKDSNTPILELGVNYQFYHKNNIAIPVSYNQEVANTKEKYGSADLHATGMNNLVDAFLLSTIPTSINSQISLSHFFSYVKVSVDIAGDHSGDRLRLKYTDETSAANYTVNVSFDSWEETVNENKYIFNMAILPAVFSPSSPVTIEVSNDAGANYAEVAKYVTNSKFEAGKHGRIVADKKWYLNEINETSMPMTETWTIHDNSVSIPYYWLGLKNALATLAAGTNVNIHFPNLETIPSDVFKDLQTSASWTLSAPMATSVGSNAFSGAANITAINLPKAIELGEGAFATSSLRKINVAADEKLTSSSTLLFGSDNTSQRANMLNIDLITNVSNQRLSMFVQANGSLVGRFKSVNEHAGTPFHSGTEIWYSGWVTIKVGSGWWAYEEDVYWNSPMSGPLFPTNLSGSNIGVYDGHMKTLKFMVKSGEKEDNHLYRYTTWTTSHPNYVAVTDTGNGKVRLNIHNGSLPKGNTYVTITAMDNTGDPANNKTLVFKFSK